MTLTVTPTTPRISYTVGSTAQTDFAVPFPFDGTDDLAVAVNGVSATFSMLGGETADGFYVGATLRLNVAAPAAAVVVIERSTLLQQKVAFPTGGAFRTAALNREVSRLWMADQDGATRDARALRTSQVEGSIAELPAAATRQGGLLGFDTAGQPAIYRVPATVVQQSPFRVRDFGARGTGATDSVSVAAEIAAIKACFNAAAAAKQNISYWGPNSPSVWFDPGAYVAWFDIPNGIDVDGAGEAATLIICPGGSNRSAVRLLPLAAAPAAGISAHIRQSLRNLKIDAYGAGQTQGHGIELVNNTFLSGTAYGIGATITDVTVLGAKESGIYQGTNRNWCLLDRVTSTDHTGGAALYLTSYDNRVTDCDFGASQFGINMATGAGNSFIGNNIWSNSEAAVVKSEYCGAYHYFTNCTFDGSGKQAVYAKSDAYASEDSIIAFVDCSWRDNGAVADNTWPMIQLVDGQRLVVTGGRVSRTNGTNRHNYLVATAGSGASQVAWQGVSYERNNAGTKPYASGVFSDNSVCRSIHADLPTSSPGVSGSYWRDAANGNVIKMVP